MTLGTEYAEHSSVVVNSSPVSASSEEGRIHVTTTVEPSSRESALTVSVSDH